MRFGFATLLLLFFGLAAGTGPGRASDAQCPMPSADKPAFRILTAEPTSGAPLTVAWDDPWASADACGGARYLVLALPREVRFSGNGFLAQEPGAPAPFGIGFAADRMRVFVPLHDADHRSGRLDILPYVTGELGIGWALVHVPDAGDDVRAASIVEGEPLSVELAPGRPRIIVQDPFDVEKPTETILSNDGAFLLEVREGTFRVLNAGSGALVYAGPGYEPNFSPGSRYAHAVGPAIELEEGISHLRSGLVVVDLYAERPILELDGGGGSRTDFIHALNWAWNDSLLMVGYVGAGAVTFRQMLHDDRPPVFNAYGCGGCTFADGGLAELRSVDGLLRLGHGPSGENYDAVDLVDPARTRVFSYDEPAPPSLEGFATANPSLIETLDLTDPGSRSWVLYNPEDDRPREPVKTHRVLGQAQAVAALSSDTDETQTRSAVALAKSAGIRPLPRAIARLASFGIVLRPGPQLVAQPSQDKIDALVLPQDDPRWDELEYYDDDGEPIEENLRALAARPQNCPAVMPALVAGSLTIERARTLCATEALALYEERLDTCPESDAYTWTLAADDSVSIVHQRICRMGTSSSAYGLVTFLRDEPTSQRGELLSGHPYLFLTDEMEETEIDDDPAMKGLVPVFGEAPLAVFALADDRLALAGRDKRIMVVDPATLRITTTIASPSSAEDIELLALLSDGAHLLQLDRDGRFHVFALADGSTTLSGLYVDDELVVMDQNLRYDSTPEGARFAQVKFPGDRDLYSLQNLAAQLKVEKLVAARLGQRPDPAQARPVGRPPQVEVSDRHPDKVGLRMKASGGLASLSLFRDGIRIAREPLSGKSAETTIDLPALSETRWFSLQVTDRNGLSSRTIALPHERGGIAAPEGRLFVLAVGTDRFDDPKIPSLRYAVADARAFAAAFSRPGPYAAVETEVLADDEDLGRTLFERIDGIRARMRPQDTLFLHIAGHGLTDDTGRLHLAQRSTRLDDLDATALPFEPLAERLGTLPGRVMVFLDACHSGAAGTTSNDDAVDVLLRRDRPIAVLAASKGRQFSYESSALRGGAFTGAIVAAFGAAETDLDRNGVVELDELYARVKADVVDATRAEQTPWIARSGFVGPVPLY